MLGQPHTICIVVVGSLLSGEAAEAQAPASAPARAEAAATQAATQATARAKVLFSRAETRYRQRDFNAALGDYQAAYQLARKPGLLFNVAQCYRQLRQPDQALFYYRLYLSDWERQHVDEAPPYLSEVQAHIGALTAQTQRRRAPPASALAAQPAASRPVSASTAAPGDAPAWRRYAGWSGVAAGGALLITGVVLGALAQSKADEYHNAYYDQLQAIDEAGQRYETGQIVTLVAGGVLAAAGGGLLLFDHLTRRSDQRRVSLRLGATRLALRVVW